MRGLGEQVYYNVNGTKGVKEFEMPESEQALLQGWASFSKTENGGSHNPNAAVTVDAVPSARANEARNQPINL